MVLFRTKRGHWSARASCQQR